MLETMYYFGILHRMSNSRVRERGKYLLNLLELPAETKLIRKLRYNIVKGLNMCLLLYSHTHTLH